MLAVTLAEGDKMMLLLKMAAVLNLAECCDVNLEVVDTEAAGVADGVSAKDELLPDAPPEDPAAEVLAAVPADIDIDDVVVVDQLVRDGEEAGEGEAATEVGAAAAPMAKVVSMEEDAADADDTADTE